MILPHILACYYRLELNLCFSNFSDGLSNKEESRTPDGAVHGSYTYRDPHGRLITNTYVADASGFRYTFPTILRLSSGKISGRYYF